MYFRSERRRSLDVEVEVDEDVNWGRVDMGMAMGGELPGHLLVVVTEGNEARSRFEYSTI